jgi:glycosyltransferase involved in cell wall biosynthesis
MLKLAYFVNQYPKVSHSFIRREILALERQGCEVQRIALRGWAEPLPDLADQSERDQTRYVFRQGIAPLVLSLLAACARSPLKFLQALALACRMSRNSDRPLPYHLAYLAEACRIIPWLRDFGAQHLHAHFGSNSTEVAMLATALGGPPYSFTVHGPGEFRQPVGLAEKIRRASFVVAISSFGRSQLYLHTCYSDWPKVKVIHCGLERSFYESAATPLGPRPKLVCVGRLCEDKGQLLLIEAAARLNAKDVPFELVLAGDGPMRAEIEAFIERYGLQQRVRITGWLSSSQVREEILASRALVLPSFAEGLPVVLMEAMALRRPVLTTYIAGIPELVRHGRDGWLFPAGSIEALARAMEDCLAKSPEELQAMGEAAHDRVVARHSVEIEAAKLVQLFHAPAAGLAAVHYGQRQTAGEA